MGCHPHSIILVPASCKAPNSTVPGHYFTRNGPNYRVYCCVIYDLCCIVLDLHVKFLLKEIREQRVSTGHGFLIYVTTTVV